MAKKLPKIKYDPLKGWHEDTSDAPKTVLPNRGSSYCTKDGQRFKVTDSNTIMPSAMDDENRPDSDGKWRK